MSGESTKTDTKRDRLENTVSGHEEISVAYLFGSAARDEATVGSDIDVAILVAKELPDPLRHRAELVEELTRACGVSVDVVLLGEAPPELASRVVREGELLLSRDESARVRFETEALRRYFDTARMRRELDRALLSDLREGRFLG